MTYARVIPRDLFNEANLLKCLGQLQLALEPHWGHDAAFDEEACENGFEVEQDPGDGSISVVSLPFKVMGRAVRLYRPLNSRQPWPLWVSASTIDPALDDFRVFDDDGNLSADMRTFIRYGRDPHL